MIFVLGPAVYEDTTYVDGKPTKMHYVIGIVSWGHGCANKGNPGFYFKVTGALQWIHNIIDMPLRPSTHQPSTYLPPTYRPSTHRPSAYHQTNNTIKKTTRNVTLREGNKFIYPTCFTNFNGFNA